MRTIQDVTLIAATVSTGLVAGLLGAFACAVMPALRGADDRTFVDVMQRINVAIINPVFLSVFVGGLLVTIAAAAAHWPKDERDALPWIIAGLALYAMTVIITGRFNIPLNDELDAAGDPNRIGDIRALRDRFEGKWVAWNIVRSITNIAACGCLAYALIVSGRASASADVDAATPAAAIQSSPSGPLVPHAPGRLGITVD